MMSVMQSIAGAAISWSPDFYAEDYSGNFSSDDNRPCWFDDGARQMTALTMPPRVISPADPVWVQVGPALDSIDIVPTTVAVANAHLLVGGKGGLAQFFPHNQHWVAVPPPLPIAAENIPTVRDVQVHQQMAYVLWSADAAENFFPYVPSQMVWHYESSAPGHMAALLVFQDVIYAGNPDGVFCRVDETDHWVSVGNLLPRGVTALAGDAESGRLFAGLSDGRVARYRDGIGEWKIFLPAQDAAVTALAIDQHNLWIGTVNGAQHCWGDPLNGMSTPQCEVLQSAHEFPVSVSVHRWLQGDAGVFAATDEGLLRYLPDWNQWEQLAYDIDPDAAIPQACRGAALGSDLYVTTGQSVYRYNRALTP